jgi:hypothetical protein
MQQVRVGVRQYDVVAILRPFGPVEHAARDELGLAHPREYPPVLLRRTALLPAATAVVGGPLR